ncbi:receptor-like protein Cf-9 [Populus alba x Populus x berolinensis]|nr:receptor-like protein Cf-9 [Populus alba x Populus x berolinensis]
MKFSLSLTQFLCSILFLFHFHATISSSFSSNHSSSNHLCAHHQSLSLLQFKQSFPINSSASSIYCQYPFAKTESWKDGTDCFLWDGVTCDMKTGQVTGLNLSCSMLYGTLHSNNSLFSLHHLQELDLSFNDFNYSHISSRFGQFSNLTHLNLSYSNFAGQVPLEASHLSKLVSLDLSENYDLSVGPISFDKLVRNLTKLRDLDLSSVNMSLVAPNSLTNLSSSLSSLYLQRCGLKGKIPGNIFLLPNLESLSLSDNEGLTGSFPSSNVSNVLWWLDLSDTRISLYLENDFISNLKSLQYMMLRNCNIVGSKLAMFGNFTRLFQLDLSSNNFIGQIPSSFGNLMHLESLDLSSNNFNGQIPSSFRNLVRLESLVLSFNKFSGQIPSSFGNLMHLEFLDLSSNIFSGQIPSSFGNLVHLDQLDLSSNNLMGQIPDSFANLTLLIYLDLSNNQLQGPIHSQLSTILDLHRLYLYGNLLNGTIPSFLFALPSLVSLGLHNNQFMGNIGEFQHNSLHFLDLSNNSLHGPIPSSIFKQENLRTLILASNSKLTGEVPPSICKLKFLQVLDLSNNNLSGSAPQCLVSNRLSVLHLGMNNLRGTIPSSFSEGSNLQYLNLNGNELEGKIPLSIVNCTMLEFLNLGNNKIEDTFPYFLEMLPELKILVLKSNKLQGFMKGPTTFNSFSKLQILDISENNLSGPLPEELFNSLEGMMNVDQDMFYMTTRNFSGYTYSIKLTWKGLEIEFVKIQSILRVLDLSSNSFTGEIPEPIGKLKGLEQLNLSHNFLTGHIQSSLGFLTSLQSLDMSSNMLTGRIPVQLTDLTFLEVLNLSQNKLEGPIPVGKQFNTFDLSSFQGNLGLCGFPMPTECNNGRVPPLPPSNFNEGDDSTLLEDGFGWKAVAMGYGCGFVFGVTMGYIVFRTRRPAWFYRMVERQWNLKGGRTKKNARIYVARRN